MPIKVYWDDEAKTIIRAEGHDYWTWDEFHAALQEIVDMMNTVNHRVDIIHNHEAGVRRPPGSGMPHFQRAIRILPSNIGMSIFINTNTFGRTIISIFTRIYGGKGASRFVMAGSLEDARARIMKDRAQEATRVS